MRRERAKRVFGGGVLVVLAACGGKPPSLEQLGDEDDCRRTVVIGGPAERLRELEDDSARQAAVSELAARWRLPPESADVVQLNAWCAAVGPAIVGGFGDTASAGARAVVDTLWLVSWNVHIGAADMVGLVEDLRSGRLTGGRGVEHFALLLQEAHRGGERVPEFDAAEPAGSGRYEGPPGGEREDIVELAEQFGLWLVYVPSMRNGETEDRGNAILATLPLEDPVAIELPVARQRRVAVAATVRARTAGGRDWSLQVANVHLESEPSGWRSAEEQRLNQAETLVELLPAAEAAVAGGDFNTRDRGQEEAAVWTMERAYPDTPPYPTGPTYQKAFGIYREYLDYLFFRLPASTAGDYRRVPRAYASDHYPLVGWVAWSRRTEISAPEPTP